MDNTVTAKSIFEAEDFQPLLEHLADDVVFKATTPEGTPISGEFCGKQAVVDYFTNPRRGRAPGYGSRGVLRPGQLLLRRTEVCKRAGPDRPVTEKRIVSIAQSSRSPR